MVKLRIDVHTIFCYNKIKCRQIASYADIPPYRKEEPMLTDIRFLIKYWRVHKKSFLTILISVIFLAIMLTASLLTERSDLRRELHTYYNANGAFDLEFLNVDNDTLSWIKGNDTVTELGEVYCIGKAEYAGSTATFGAYKNDAAAELAHYPMENGQFPQNSGEIALSQDIYNTFCPFAEIGETVTIPMYDADGNLLDETERTLVGIMGDDLSRATFENNAMNADPIHSDPKILLSYEEASQFENGYTNVMVQLCNGEEYALLDPSTDGSDPRYQKADTFRHEMFERGYYPAGIGRGLGVQMIGAARSPDEITISSKSQMIRFVSVFALIITVISLFSGISTIMHDRMHSFRLMRCIGYSKLRIQRMLILEALLVFVVGTVVGILSGICIYEGIYHLQTELFHALPYRGYTTEWVVAQKTFPPVLTTMLLTAVGVFLSYAVVIGKVSHEMNMTADRSRIMSRRNIHTAFGAVSKILSFRAVGVLQIISLVCVIFTSVVCYLYCVNDGKGETVVAQTTLSSYFAPKGIYEAESGIDLDKLGCDCYLTADMGIAQANYLAPPNAGGMTQSDIDALCKNGAENTYCYSDPFYILADADGTENRILQSNLMREEDRQIFGLEKDTSAIPCILMSDALIQKLFGAEISADGAAWVSVMDQENTLVSDAPYTIYSAKADETGWMPEEILKREMTVSSTIHTDAETLNEDEFASAVLLDLKYDTGFLLMSGEYAETLGIFNDSYHKVLFSAQGNEKDLRNMLAASVTSQMRMRAVTRYELKRDHIYDNVDQYSTIICLFVLLFSIYIIGHCNVLKLKLRQKAGTFRIMRSLGLPHKKLTGYLIADSLKQPIISMIAGAGVIGIFRRILMDKYDTYCELITKRDSLMSTDSAAADAISEQLKALRYTYLLGDEMWVLSWSQAFAVVSLVVCVLCIVCVAVMQKKHVTSELADGLSERKE